jgi:iron complex transport system substrate-binding protein
VPAFHPLRPRRPVRRAPFAALAILAFLIAACGGGATPRPSVPPDATGSLLPPATAFASSPVDASVAPSAAAAAFPLTLTGDDGVAVTLAAEPTKIVSLTPAETEVIYALGAGDKVVGKVEDIADFPPEAAKVPVVATFSGVDLEKIVALGADLVIAGGNGGTPQDAIDRLRSLKVPVLVVYAPDVTGALRDIVLTGDAIGEPAGASALTSSMQTGFAAITAATGSAARPKVFYETGDQPAIYGIADDSVYAEMITLAGGSPVTTGSATNWEMPAEKLVAADPDLIILGDSAYGVTAAAVAKRPGWKDLAAVKAGAIKPIDDIVVTRPGPRLLDGLRLLVTAIHPDVVLPSPAPSGG